MKRFCTFPFQVDPGFIFALDALAKEYAPDWLDHFELVHDGGEAKIRIVANGNVFFDHDENPTTFRDVPVSVLWQQMAAYCSLHVTIDAKMLANQLDAESADHILRRTFYYDDHTENYGGAK